MVLGTGVGHLTSQPRTCEKQKGVELSGEHSVPSVDVLELGLKVPVCLRSSLVPGEKKNRRYQPAEGLSVSLKHPTGVPVI